MPTKIEYFLRKKLNRLDYFGLHQLDRILEQHLPEFGGVFLEAGANDGISYSNTAFFERYKGWTGILVEPIPEMAERCVRNRPKAHVVHAALGSPDQSGTLVPMTWCNMMSIVAGAMGSEKSDAEYIGLGLPHLKAFDTNAHNPYVVHVPITTLSEIISRFDIGPIDFLSLDVEGYELQALSGLDFTRHAPRMILVECLFKEQEIIRQLIPHYDLIGDVGQKDLLFRRRPG